MTTTPARLAIAVTGLRKSFGDQVVLDGIDLAVPEGTIFSLLGPNGAGKTTAVQILSTLITADGGDIRVAGHDLAAEPDAVRAAIGVTGQFSAVDNLLTGDGEPAADGRPAPPRPRRRTAPRAAELLRQFDLADAAGKLGRHLLRRDAAAARPGHDPGRQPAADLPGRADHRARPAQPPHHVADHPRPGRQRHHHPPHHPVPGRGRPARRPDRACSTTAGSWPTGPPTSSSGAIPGGHIELQLRRAARARVGQPAPGRSRRATTRP